MGAAIILTAEALTRVGSFIRGGTIDEGQRCLGPEALAGDGCGEAERIVMSAAADDRVVLPVKMGAKNRPNQQRIQIQILGDTPATEFDH